MTCSLIITKWLRFSEQRQIVLYSIVIVLMKLMLKHVDVSIHWGNCIAKFNHVAIYHNFISR